MTTEKGGQFLTRKRVVILVVAALVALAGVGIVSYALSGPPAQPAIEKPLPPAGQVPLEDTDLNQVKEALGPFTTIAVSADSPNPDTSHPAVLLLNQDGSTQASENWTVPFNGSTSWTQGDVAQIRSISLNVGYVTFGTNLQRTFVVKANQPFIFEEAPERVVVVDAQGNTWSSTMSRAQASRQPLK